MIRPQSPPSRIPACWFQSWWGRCWGGETPWSSKQRNLYIQWWGEGSVPWKVSGVSRGWTGRQRPALGRGRRGGEPGRRTGGGGRWRRGSGSTGRRRPAPWGPPARRYPPLMTDKIGKINNTNSIETQSVKPSIHQWQLQYTMFRSIENQMIKEIVWENSIFFHSRSRNDQNCFQIIAQLSMFH